MKPNLTWIYLILAFASATFAGWIDFNNDKSQAAFLVILSATFILGVFFRTKAWRWALIITTGLPAVYLAVRAMGHQPVSPPRPRWYASLIAIIPTFIGAYAGVFGRLMINRLFEQSHP